MPGPTRTPIPVMTAFDKAAFDRDYRTAAHPVVLKGAAASWPAVASWSPEYFGEKFAAMEITPSVSLPDTEVPYTFKDVDHRQKMTVHDFVARMATGDRCYVDQMRVASYEGIEREYPFEQLGPDDVKDILLWMGSRTRSGLHYDYIDNLFAQIHGTKLAVLAAPSEAPNLHVFPDCHTKSQVAPQHPDLGKHPRVGKATLLEATLEPGDVLFIPKGWWHYFASSERSISLSCWHGTPLPPTYDIGVMLSLRSPKAWARLVSDFVWYGLLRRPYQRRLYSPPPTGRMLYELLAGMMPGRRR
jgi:lysine-specific demethylase 8